MIKMDCIEYRKKYNLKKKEWKHVLTTNCYAFALGLDIRERLIMKDAYQPGTLTHHSLDMFFTYDELIECILSDLDFLGIDYIESNPIEEIKENEWKIAIFTQYSKYINNKEFFSDFHFLRQIDECWYHKLGYYDYPTNKDYHNNIIINPTECFILNKEYQKTYKLKLKKN